MWPVATASVTAAMRSAASRALVIGGNENVTGSIFAGRVNSVEAEPQRHRITIQRHVDSLRYSASACPSNKASQAKVAAFREPLGRPLGLPDVPFSNRPTCFLPVFSGLFIWPPAWPFQVFPDRP